MPRRSCSCASDGAHADAELRIEVRQRLVHEEGLRLADDRAPHRDTLALAAGERGRAPVEQLGEAQQLGHLLDPPTRVVLRRPADFQSVAEVLAHRHVRVQRVVLEDHRDVAMPRREVGDVTVADADVPLGDVLEPRDHPQQRRFAAARRAHEDHELAVPDLERNVVDRHDAAGEPLRDVTEGDAGHRAMV